MTGFSTLQAPATLAVVLPALMMPRLDFAAFARNAVAGGRCSGMAASAGIKLAIVLIIAGICALRMTV